MAPTPIATGQVRLDPLRCKSQRLEADVAAQHSPHHSAWRPVGLVAQTGDAALIMQKPAWGNSDLQYNEVVLKVRNEARAWNWEPG